MKQNQKNNLKLVPFVITALFYVVANSATPKPTTKNASQKLNDWFEKQFQIELDYSPMTCTYLGIKKNYDKWDDITRASEKAAIERAKKRLVYLTDSVDVASLDKPTKLSYKLALSDLKNEIEGDAYNLYNYPINQMFGYHTQVPSFLINMHLVTTKQDADNYISRLNGVKSFLDQVIEKLKIRHAEGINLPKYLYPKVIGACENVITGLPFNGKENSTLLEDFSKKVKSLEISEKEKEQLLEAAKTALNNSVEPAYQKVITYLKSEQNEADNTSGVWRFKKGLDFYNYALAKTTTTKMTANEVHELGKSEVIRIQNEMKEIKYKVGFKGTLSEFFKFMQDDPQFYFEDSDAGREAYMAEARGIIDSMRTKLDALFITKPKADIKVKRVEAFREKSAGLAFYQRPAPDGSRPGTYYANMYKIKSMSKFEMEALAFHEGIPGHHMQIAIAQELKDIPKFRKFGGYTAYIEGWGLYSEYIPKEIGFYKDPYSDFGRLSMELFRACRLVVDTGIHAKKWTREQGIDYYKKNTPTEEFDIIKMVERHVVMPSQATAYKVGMNKILALRKKSKEALGAKFDIRQFHDVILTNGALPLDVLETLVDEWIASKK